MDRMISINEACQQLGIGRSTFYREVAAGRLTIRKAGCRSLIRQSDLDAWMEALPTLKPATSDAA